MKMRAMWVVLAGCLAAVSHATVLTFDVDNTSSGSLVDNNYGDNVTAATMGAFHYGIANGITPDVTVSYLGKGSQQQLNIWESGFNDLNRVANYEPDGDPGFSLTLTAAAGWNVSLDSFDLGNFGGDITIPSLTIYGEGNTVLFQQNNFVLPGSANPHQDYDFSPALVSQSLRIDFDLTGLGGSSDNVGIDNISFTQVATAPVPEPASMAALGVGALALLRRKRKQG